MQTGIIDYIILGIAMAGILAYIIMYRYSFHVYFTRSLAKASAYLLGAATLFLAGNIIPIPPAVDMMLRVLALPLLFLSVKQFFKNTCPYYISCETENTKPPKYIADGHFKLKATDKNKKNWTVEERSPLFNNYFFSIEDAAGCLSTIIFLEYGHSDRYRWFDKDFPDEILLEWQPLNWYKHPGLYELSTHRLVYRANDTQATIDGMTYKIKSQYQ